MSTTANSTLLLPFQPSSMTSAQLAAVSYLGVLDELADGDEGGGDEVLVAGSSYRLNVRGGR
jgi:hypothetical protein